MIGQKLEARLLSPIDIAPLVAWRIALGALFVVEAIGGMLTGWVDEAYVRPAFHFSYFGFEWVRPIPGYPIHLHYVLLAILGGLVALGLFYRVAALLLALAWSYVFLLEKAFYQNHHYLMLLIAWLMVVVPAAHAGSLDARRRPELATRFVSAWSLDVFRVLITLVYFYAGLAKLNPDWLDLMPIERWLRAKASYPLIGALYASRFTAFAFAYGGVVFDLAAAPLLWWKKTRLAAVAIAIFFHVANLVTFRIGIFPLVAIALTCLFLPPAWFARALSRLLASAPERVPTPRRWVLPLLAAFFVVQLVLPLRHHLIDGNVEWSEEGHRFSWRMMLRSKRGTATFHVRDPKSGKTLLVHPRQHLQGRQISKLATQPDLIWQFARFLEDHYRRQGLGDVEVRASTKVSLNFRPRQALVDPNVDLTEVDYRLLSHNSWILPLADQGR